MDFFDVATEETGCLFAGRWNPFCGDPDLVVSFTRLSDEADSVVFAYSNPVFFISAEITSAREAVLVGWDTDLSFSNIRGLSGNAQLSENGTALRIEVSTFSDSFTIDGCRFSSYVGNYRF